MSEVDQQHWKQTWSSANQVELNFSFSFLYVFFFHEKLQTQIDVWNKKEWYFTICTNLWESYVVLHHVRRKNINLSNVRNQTFFMFYWNSLFFCIFSDFNYKRGFNVVWRKNILTCVQRVRRPEAEVWSALQFCWQIIFLT